MDKEEKILGIEDTELNDLIIKNFTRYNEVYKSLAEKERREELDKIID